MIRPVEDGLVMQQLLYAAEVRSIKDIDIPKTEVRDAELRLAQQLIEQQTAERFEPSAYTDEVRARIPRLLRPPHGLDEHRQIAGHELGADLQGLLLRSLRRALAHQPGGFDD